MEWMADYRVYNDTVHNDILPACAANCAPRARYAAPGGSIPPAQQQSRAEYVPNLAVPAVRVSVRVCDRFRACSCAPLRIVRCSPLCNAHRA